MGYNFIDQSERKKFDLIVVSSLVVGVINALIMIWLIYHDYDYLYEYYIIFFSFLIIPLSALGFCYTERLSLLLLMSGQLIFFICYVYAGFMS